MLCLVSPLSAVWVAIQFEIHKVGQQTNTVAQRGIQLNFCICDLMVPWDSFGQN